MSTWISSSFVKLTICGTILAFGLSACASSRLGGNGKVSRARGAAASTTIQVSSKNFVIKGPPGFCVDQSVTEVQGDNAFVLLGNCAVVSPQARAVQPDVRALLTASISGSGQGTATIRDSVTDMDAFFRSENGRTALSRNSDPGTVQVLETFHKDETFFVRASDNSPGIVPGASADYWRAYFDLDDQIVSVSVIGFQNEPLAPEKSLTTLRQFANAIKTSNGGVAEELPIQSTENTTVAEVIDEPQQSQKPRRKISAGATLMTIGILRRIFGS